MSKFLKQFLFVVVGLAVIATGVFVVQAVSNRGAEPYIYMRFNEGYGSTVYDEQGNVNGTITGAVWKTEDECMEGKCLYFDGTGDYVSISDFDLE